MEERFECDNMMRGTNLQIILLVSYTKYGFGDKKESVTKNITCILWEYRII